MCLQAGNVNTGACDNLRLASEIAHRSGAWVHVDGAFGLWAAANPSTRHLVDGIELADSWGCDGHKWLNVPYDSGFVFCSRPDVHVAAASYTASYLTGSGGGAGRTFGLHPRVLATGTGVRRLGRAAGSSAVTASPTSSSGTAVWRGGSPTPSPRAVPRSPTTSCSTRCSSRSATTPARTAVIDAIQRDGTCWMGGTTWRGRRYMRIAVSNYSTTEADVDRSVAAIVRLAAQV